MDPQAPPQRRRALDNAPVDQAQHQKSTGPPSKKKKKARDKPVVATSLEDLLQSTPVQDKRALEQCRKVVQRLWSIGEHVREATSKTKQAEKRVSIVESKMELLKKKIAECKIKESNLDPMVKLMIELFAAELHRNGILPYPNLATFTVRLTGVTLSAAKRIVRTIGWYLPACREYQPWQYFCDRWKLVIVVKGENLYPANGPYLWSHFAKDSWQSPHAVVGEILVNGAWIHKKRIKMDDGSRPWKAEPIICTTAEDVRSLLGPKADKTYADSFAISLGRMHATYKNVRIDGVIAPGGLPTVSRDLYTSIWSPNRYQQNDMDSLKVFKFPNHFTMLQKNLEARIAGEPLPHPHLVAEPTSTESEDTDDSEIEAFTPDPPPKKRRRSIKKRERQPSPPMSNRDRLEPVSFSGRHKLKVRDHLGTPPRRCSEVEAGRGVPYMMKLVDQCRELVWYHKAKVKMVEERYKLIESDQVKALEKEIKRIQRKYQEVKQQLVRLEDAGPEEATYLLPGYDPEDLLECPVIRPLPPDYSFHSDDDCSRSQDEDFEMEPEPSQQSDLPLEIGPSQESLPSQLHLDSDDDSDVLPAPRREPHQVLLKPIDMVSLSLSSGNEET